MASDYCVEYAGKSHYFKNIADARAYAVRTGRMEKNITKNGKIVGTVFSIGYLHVWRSEEREWRTVNTYRYGPMRVRIRKSYELNPDGTLNGRTYRKKFLDEDIKESLGNIEWDYY